MARIDELIGEVPDPTLRRSLAAALGKLRSTRRFGLVFEDHIPETVAIPGLPIEIGSLVQRRDDVSEGVVDLEDAAQALTDRTACLLGSHGMISRGPTLESAVSLAHRLEIMCRQ